MLKNLGAGLIERGRSLDEKDEEKGRSY